VAIAYDATTRYPVTDGTTVATGNLTFSHAGAAGARGAVVVLLSATTSAVVTGVLYGGVAMTLTTTATDTSEAGRIDIYTLVVGAPTGTQTVTLQGCTSAAKWAQCTTVAAASSAVTVNASNVVNTTTSTNPQVGLVTTATTLAIGGVHSGNASVLTVPLTGVTIQEDQDYGALVAMAVRRTAVDAAGTIPLGFTFATSDDWCAAGVAIAELAQVTQSIAETWSVRGAVPQTVAESWAVRSAVTQTVAEAWKILLFPVSPQTVAVGWSVRVPIASAKTVAETWGVRRAVGQAVVEQWKVATRITQTVAESWAVRHVIVDGYVSGYIRGYTAAGSTFRATGQTWNVRTVVTQTIVGTWTVTGRITKTVAEAWTVRVPIASAKTVTQTWAVRHVVVDGYVGGYNRGYTAAGNAYKPTSQLWAVKKTVAQTVAQTWDDLTLLTPVVPTMVQSWAVRVRIVATVAGSWNVFTIPGTTITQAWGVRAAVPKTVAQTWFVRSVIAAASTGQTWAVATAVASTVLQAWGIDSEVTVAVLQVWNVKTTNTVVQTIAQVWAILWYAQLPTPVTVRLSPNVAVTQISNGKPASVVIGGISGVSETPGTVRVDQSTITTVQLDRSAATVVVG
jgi:hypothetical protein